MKTADIKNLLAILQQRFLSHMARHPNIEWAAVEAKLRANTAKIAALDAMEQSGGEPDLIGVDAATGEYIFCDCAAESPTGRRSLCYDQAALDARKENKPKGNAVATAAAMGIELLTEQDYRHLQTLGEFDKKTSSWIATSQAVRALGGALFCDRRYGQVFTYHNGAESYYAARGFRGILRV